MSHNKQKIEMEKDREFTFTADDFSKIKSLIYEYAGISLNPSKQDMVYSRLSRRLRKNKLASFHDYLQLLEKRPPAEWEAFVNALTTNLTSFFREQHHFPILAEHILKHYNGRDKISLWCSASSTGEEPYSMAMTMIDAFNSFDPPVQIVATDLDTNVLDKAQAGIYPLDTVAKMPEKQVSRFFFARQRG